MRKLYRWEEEKRIAGICGGLCEIYGIDPTLVRLLFIFLGLATGLIPIVITYLFGWVMIPKRPPGGSILDSQGPVG